MRAVAFLVAGVLVLGASLYVDFLALFAIGLASSDSGKPVEPLEWLVFAIIAIGGLLLAAWVVRRGRRRPRGSGSEAAAVRCNDRPSAASSLHGANPMRIPKSEAAA